MNAVEMKPGIYWVGGIDGDILREESCKYYNNIVMPYGWSGEAANDIYKIMEEMKWDTPVEAERIPYIPDDTELVSMTETGRKLGEQLLKGD